MRHTLNERTLDQLASEQGALQAGQDEIKHALLIQGNTLLAITERLDLMLELLAPKAGDGPVLQELLAELVTRIGDNGVLLRRIDRRTERMASSPPDDGAGAVNGSHAR